MQLAELLIDNFLHQLRSLDIVDTDLVQLKKALNRFTTDFTTD